jgi:hypothetical protein
MRIVCAAYKAALLSDYFNIIFFCALCYLVLFFLSKFFCERLLSNLHLFEDKHNKQISQFVWKFFIFIRFFEDCSPYFLAILRATSPTTSLCEHCHGGKWLKYRIPNWFINHQRFFVLCTKSFEGVVFLTRR